MKGDYDRAIADLNEYLRQKPDDAEAIHERGLVYQEKARLPACHRQFERMLKLKPQNDIVALSPRLANCCPNRAMRRRAREIDEADPHRLSSADHYLARGDVDAKLKELDRRIADHARALKGHLLQRDGVQLIRWAHVEKGEYTQIR